MPHSDRYCRSGFCRKMATIGILVLGSAAPCFAKTDFATGTDLTANSELRSSWIFNDPDCKVPALASSYADERVLLQQHFQRVIAILIANTHRSLPIAAARWEEASGKRLTAKERSQLQQELLRRRIAQCMRLQVYAHAGRFPLNLEPNAPIRPVFVDQFGTHCAVAHLMRCSGVQEEVAMIARADNFVVVRHAKDGPLMKWILESGLTHEEVALVQPAYQPASHYEGTLGAFAFTPNALERDGVRYSNFTFSAVEFGTPSYDTNQSYLITDLTDIMPNPMPGPPNWDSGGYFVPSGTNFLALHGELGKTNVGTIKYTEQGAPYFDNSLLWKLGFDVTVTAPNKAIDMVYLTSNAFHMYTFAGRDSGWPVPLHAPDGTELSSARDFGAGYIVDFDGYAEYQTHISTGATELGSAVMGGTNTTDFFSNLNATRDISIAPTRTLHVETQLLLAGNAYSMDIAHEFNLVTIPEPSTMWLATLLTSACAFVFLKPDAYASFRRAAGWDRCVQRCPETEL